MIKLNIYHYSILVQTGEFLIELVFLIMLKNNASDVYSHNYTTIKINSEDDLLLEKNIKYV